MKKLISCMLSLCMLFSLMVCAAVPQTVAAESSGNTITEKAAQLEEKVEQARDQFLNQNYDKASEPGVFKILHLNFTNVKVQETGKTFTMSAADKTYANKVAENFKYSVENYADHNVIIENTIVFIDTQISIDTVANGRSGGVTLSMARSAYLDEHVEYGDYDAVVSTSALVDAPMGHTYAGVPAGGHAYIYYSIYGRQEIPDMERSTSASGIIIHEFCHALERYAQYLDIPMPDAHAYIPAEYPEGYKEYRSDNDYSDVDDTKAITLSTFYRDFLSGKVVYTDASGSHFTGMYPKMWAIPLRSFALGSYHIKNQASGQYLKAEQASYFSPITQGNFTHDSKYKWVVSYMWGQKYMISTNELAGMSINKMTDNQNIALLYAGDGNLKNPNQVFKISPSSNGAFKISIHSDNNVSLSMETTAGAQPYFLTTANNTKQNWYFEEFENDMTEGMYYIRNVGSGKYLNATSNRVLSLDNFQAGSAFQWKVNRLDGGFYQILSEKYTNTTMDVMNGYDLQNNKIQIYDKITPPIPAQKFLLPKDSNGSVRIMPFLSTTRYVVYDPNLEGNTRMRDISATATENEKAYYQWVFEKVEEVEDTYYIKNAASNQYITLGALTSGSYALPQTNWDGSNKQKWKVKKSADFGGYYTITSEQDSALYWDVAGGAENEGNPINARTWSNYPIAQTYQFILNNDGTYRIVPKLSSTRALEIGSGASANVTMKLFSSSNTQKWVLEKVSSVKEGTYYLKNRSNNNYLSVGAVINDVSYATSQSSFSAQNSMRWKFQYKGNGCYTVSPLSDLTLFWDCDEGVEFNGNAVNVRKWSNYPIAQTWRILTNTDGTYSFQPQLSTTRVLSVSGTSTILNTINGTDSQKWTMENTTAIKDGEYFIKTIT